MSPPLRISTVVPSYNRPDFVRRVLLAFAAQTRLVDEVVVTDDGSSVDIPSGIADVLPDLPFPVYFVRQPDEGFRAAKCRNNGIRESSGAFVIFADQDIVVGPRYVETFEAHARAGEFLVGYPIRLTEAETARVTDALIRERRVLELVPEAGRRKVRSQYRKEAWYRVLHALRLRPIGPKLRSGVFGAWRTDLLRVNGFDEEFQGWGNEDDNLGVRLHRAGIRGRNIFHDAQSLHMDHPPHHDGVRPNDGFQAERTAAIRGGEVRARHGVESPLGGMVPVRRVLHQPGV